MFFPPTNDIDTSQQPPPLPPNKPTFKMAVEPPEELIGNLVEFCASLGNPITRPNAVRFLKAKNNDVNDAFNAYYNGEDISQSEQAMQWDEGAWSQGKDGPGAGGSDGMNDSHLRPLLSSTAPTRANSPAPGARSSLHPSSKEQEDSDLAQAMAMSQGNGYFQQQESGMVSAGGQETQFGPANRNDYNMSQWAMVTTNTSTSGEIVPDAEVEERSNKAGEPRMLKQSPGAEYLANVLTILANLNGAREALLMRDRVKSDYGQDGDWWKGNPVPMPKIVALGDASGSIEEGDQYDDLLVEVQRLMAFLTATDRSYGSAGALLQTEALKSANPRSVRSNTMLELFMQTWSIAAVAKAGEESRLAHLFNTTVGTNASEGMEETHMSLIDFSVDPNPDANRSSDLMELLDGLLWDTSDPNIESDNYIERPADVLVMRLRQGMSSNGNKQLKVSVPADFYMDKYLREHIGATRATRREMAKGKKKVEKIEQIEEKLRTWRNPKDGKELDAAMLVGHTLKYYQEENKLAAAAGAQAADPPQYQELSSKLEAVITSIDEKLTTLAEEKQRTLTAIASMSHAPPPGLAAKDQKHRYILRGVATKPNITYVLAHEGDNDDDSDAEGNADNTAPDDEADTTWPGLRWWRLEYDVQPSGLGARVSKVKCGDYDVFRAVELEHDKAVLMYANMDANVPGGDPEAERAEPLPLPGPLEEFVRRDNGLFAAERSAEPQQPPPGYRDFDLAADGDSGIGGEMDGFGEDGGGKRASMDSTRAEGGRSRAGSLPDYADVGSFERNNSFGLPPDLGGGYDGDVKGGNGRGGYISGGVAGGQGYDGVVDDDDDEDGPVHEIRLDGEEGVEMVEQVQEPLAPGSGPGTGKGGGSDVEMGEGK